MEYSLILHGVCAGFQHIGGDSMCDVQRFQYFHQLSMRNITESGDKRPENLFIVERRPLKNVYYYDILYLKDIKEISRGAGIGGRNGYIGLTFATDEYIGKIAAVRSFLISVMENIVIPSLLNSSKQWQYDLSSKYANKFIHSLEDLLVNNDIFKILTRNKGESLSNPPSSGNREVEVNPEDANDEFVRGLIADGCRVFISDAYLKKSDEERYNSLNFENKKLTENIHAFENQIRLVEKKKNELEDKLSASEVHLHKIKKECNELSKENKRLKDQKDRVSDQKIDPNDRPVVTELKHKMDSDESGKGSDDIRGFFRLTLIFSALGTLISIVSFVVLIVFFCRTTSLLGKLDKLNKEPAESVIRDDRTREVYNEVKDQGVTPNESPYPVIPYIYGVESNNKE